LERLSEGLVCAAALAGENVALTGRTTCGTSRRQQHFKPHCTTTRRLRAFAGSADYLCRNKAVARVMIGLSPAPRSR
jgi:hypothetical protein